MAMFPDSGVPPAEAKNSLPDVDTASCDELWYSTSRCQPRFDPAAANAMLAEQMNLIMRSETQYECLRLDHIERAVRYINQRGIPRGAFITGGPNAYITALDPPMTRYNDFMTLTLVPAATCGEGVTLDINGKGAVPILRNDGLALKSFDMKLNRPLIVTYWQGAFYVVGFVQSQVPQRGYGSVDGWIRTDGNDTTGDGTENTAAKAFKTINGAYLAINSRYVQSPGFRINLKLGIPGTYAGALIANANNVVTLIGDRANRGAYRIAGAVYPSGEASSFYCAECSALVSVQGVTFMLDTAASQHSGVLAQRSQVSVLDCSWLQTVSNPGAIVILCGDGKVHMSGSLVVTGAGSMLSLIYNDTGIVADAGGPSPHTWSISNVSFNTTIIVTQLGIVKWGPSQPALSNVSGIKYNVFANAILSLASGANVPGNVAGSVSSGGQVI